MVKKLWMLCCIMMVMVVTTIVNVSVTEANGWTITDGSDWDEDSFAYSFLEPEVEPKHLKELKYLIGNYRITEVFQNGDNYDRNIRMEDKGAVIRIMCYKTSEFFGVFGELMCGKLISAPDNTRFAKALDKLEVVKTESKAEYGSEEYNYDNIGYEIFSGIMLGNKVNNPNGANFVMRVCPLTHTNYDYDYDADCYLSGNKIYVYSRIYSSRANRDIITKRFVLERISSNADDAMKEVGYLTKPVEQPRTPSSAEAKPNIRYHVEHVYLNSPGVATIEGYFANDGDIDGYAKLVELDLTLTADNGQQMWAYSGIRHDVNIEVPANKYVNYTIYVQHKNIPEYHKRFKWKANTNTHWSTSAS